MRINKHIEIIGSSKSRLNAMSKKTQQSVLTTLQKKYTRVETTIVDTLQDLETLVAKRPDLVILGRRRINLAPVEGSTKSTKLWISDYLAENNINFAGSGTNPLRLQLDKPVAKQHILDAGLQSAAYFISTMEEPVFQHDLDFPLFVKPTDCGQSKGVDEKSVVHTLEELEAKILSIHVDYRSDALVEEFLSGREFSVAVVEDEMGNCSAMPIEILSPTDKNGYNFLSSAVKKADSERVVAVTDEIVKTAVNDLAIGVFKSLGARDYGRIDIRLNSDGVPSFIEANLTPGLSNHGYLSRCFLINNQTSYDDMIFGIMDLGVQRGMDIARLMLPETTSLVVPEFAAAAA